jgi:hypothetical protein
MDDRSQVRRLEWETEFVSKTESCSSESPFSVSPSTGRAACVAVRSRMAYEDDGGTCACMIGNISHARKNNLNLALSPACLLACLLAVPPVPALLWPSTDFARCTFRSFVVSFPWRVTSLNTFAHHVPLGFQHSAPARCIVFIINPANW